MGKKLKSLGLDLGTTTTQLVISELEVENRAPGFTVPRMEIGKRRVLYQSPIHFTPLISGELVDGQAISELLKREMEKAGVTPEQLDTGAVIVTGETSRKENAETVTRALASAAGKFVVATAGPDLESVLAARGAGAAELSEQTGKPVIHLDIGGGTANLALCREGNAEPAGCLNVGGRLIQCDAGGTVTWVSPAVKGITEIRAGDTLTEERAMAFARLLARALEEALGFRKETELSRSLRTPGAVKMPLPKGILSFSGGVADCMEKELPWLSYGDIGPLLGRAIRESALCREDYRLGTNTIRATVIGAGSHSVQLSGSTVFLKNARLPKKDLTAAVLTEEEQNREDLAQLVARRMEGKDLLFLPGWVSPDYEKICRVAEELVGGFGSRPCRVVLEQDMAKALGVALQLRLPKDREILCLDGLWIPRDSYLDVGQPVGPAVTAVIKTLAFERVDS